MSSIKAIEESPIEAPSTPMAEEESRLEVPSAPMAEEESKLEVSPEPTSTSEIETDPSRASAPEVSSSNVQEKRQFFEQSAKESPSQDRRAPSLTASYSVEHLRSKFEQKKTPSNEDVQKASPHPHRDKP